MYSHIITDNNHIPYGVVLGKEIDGVFRIGWSMCNWKSGDSFDLDKATQIATLRLNGFSKIYKIKTDDFYIAQTVNNVFFFTLNHKKTKTFTSSNKAEKAVAHLKRVSTRKFKILSGIQRKPCSWPNLYKGTPTGGKAMKVRHAINNLINKYANNLKTNMRVKTTTLKLNKQQKNFKQLKTDIENYNVRFPRVKILLKEIKNEIR